MSDGRIDPDYRAVATYDCHWTFWALPEPADRYAHGLNSVWITSDLEGPVLRSVTCNHMHQVLVVRVRVVADDLMRAIEWAAALVFGLMDRAELAFPSRVSLLAACVGEVDEVGDRNLQ